MVIPPLNNQTYSLAYWCIIRDNLHHPVRTYLFNRFYNNIGNELCIFTSPEQSSAFKNIAPFGEVAMIFINGLRLVSVHPS